MNGSMTAVRNTDLMSSHGVMGAATLHRPGFMNVTAALIIKIHASPMAYANTMCGSGLFIVSSHNASLQDLARLRDNILEAVVGLLTLVVHSSA